MTAFLDLEIPNDRFELSFSKINVEHLGLMKQKYAEYKTEAKLRSLQTSSSILAGSTLLAPRSIKLKLSEEDMKKAGLHRVGINEVFLLIKLFKYHPQYLEYAQTLKAACEKSHSPDRKVKLRERIKEWLKLLELLPNRTTFAAFYAAAKYFQFHLMLPIFKYLLE